MKKVVLWIGFGVSVFIILLGIADEKFGLNCTYVIKENGIYNIPFIQEDFPTFKGPYYTYDDIEKITWCEPIVFSFMPFLPLLLLSLITYRLKDEVFTAWWSFARWWVPVIIITTIYFETAGGGGGGWGMSSGMDEFLVLSLLYIIFIITSLVKIVRAYTRAKQGVADKQGNLRELEQKVAIGDSKIEGHYDAKKNTTTIKKKLKEKHDDERETKEVFEGLRILELTTERAVVNVNY